jgi:hypothetical protein
VPEREIRILSTAHWRLAATQDEMREAGMQEGRNKSDTRRRFVASPAFLPSCIP